MFRVYLQLSDGHCTSPVPVLETITPNRLHFFPDVHLIVIEVLVGAAVAAIVMKLVECFPAVFPNQSLVEFGVLLQRGDGVRIFSVVAIFLHLPKLVEVTAFHLQVLLLHCGRYFFVD